MAKLLKGSTVGGKDIATVDELTPVITDINSHKLNNEIHITTAERTAWNAKAGGAHEHGVAEITGLQTALDGKETPAGAQTKATKALTDSKLYTDVKVAEIVGSAPDTLDTLNELAEALGRDPNFATTVATQIGGKVDKVAGKVLSTNDFTTAEKTKLTGIATGAQVNTVSSVAGRTGAIVLTKTDVGLPLVENIKQATKAEFDTHANDSTLHFTSAEKTKLTSIATGANNYSHPATHPASMIVQDPNNRMLSDAKIAELESKSAGAHIHKTEDIKGLTDGGANIHVDNFTADNVALFQDDIVSRGEYFTSLTSGDNILVINRDGTLYYQGVDIDFKYASAGDMETLAADTSNSMDAMENVIADHSFNVASDLVLGHIKVGANLTISADGTLNATGGKPYVFSPTPPSSSEKDKFWVDSSKHLYTWVDADGGWSVVSPKITLNNTLTSTSTTEAATANAVKLVNDKVLDATTARKGIVQLNNTLTSTSTIEAATAQVVKTVYDSTVNLNALNNTNNVRIGASATVGAYSVALGQSANASQNFSVALGSFSSASMYNDAKLGVPKDNSGPWNWLIPGQLTVSGYKNFEIEHPHPDKKDTHKIRHGAVESPSAGDTLYRFNLQVDGDNCTVKLYGVNSVQTLPVVFEDDCYKVSILLPDYFIYLNSNIQTTISPDKHFGAGYGEVDMELGLLNITLNSKKNYHIILFGTRNDDNVQDWNIRGVEREIGESWNGDTYNLEEEEIIVFDEFTEEEAI